MIVGVDIVFRLEVASMGIRCRDKVVRVAGSNWDRHCSPIIFINSSLVLVRMSKCSVCGVKEGCRDDDVEKIGSNV